MELRNSFKVIAVLLAAGVYATIYSSVTGASPCVLYGLAGIPCPACGVTRAVFSLFRGDIMQAFRYHPLFWYLGIIPLLSVRTKKNGLSEAVLKRIYAVLTVVLCAVWVIRMVLYFPNVEPMVINQSAVIPVLLRQVF